MALQEFRTDAGEIVEVEHSILPRHISIGESIVWQGRRLTRIASQFTANTNQHLAKMPEKGSRTLPRGLPGFKTNKLGQTVVTNQRELQQAMDMTGMERT